MIDRLGGDRTSGASELMGPAIAAIRLAAPGGPRAVEEAALAICEAQPSMASLRNLAVAARHEAVEPGALDRFEQRWQRSAGALVRVAQGALAPEPGRPGRFVTCSFSGSVLACLQAIAATAPLHVSCGEGRPAFEGRRMAEALAEAGIEVELRTDAALSGALPGTDGLLVGADAITPAWFLNKCGTTQLAAAAAHVGTAVYVVATRDKVVDRQAGESLGIDDHDPREVWDAAPPGIAVRNPYFERVPMELVTAVITDGGVRAVGAASG